MMLTERFKVYNKSNIRKIKQLEILSDERINEIELLSNIFPFRVNNYVIDELIKWNDFQNDPIFNMVFPNKDMISNEEYTKLKDALATNNRVSIRKTVDDIRKNLNPHPGDQMTLNVPTTNEFNVSGLQHKYKETVLFFPKEGQFCHSYCSYCFRWAQFIGNKELRFESSEVQTLLNYLRKNPSVTDVLFTGGDPMVMNIDTIKKYINPLLEDSSINIQNIRIGTKSLAYWPYRYINDQDSKELLEYFKKIIDSGKNLSIMAHFSHWRELETDACSIAVKNIRETGAVIRSQAPLLANVNDKPEIWSKMWKLQVKLGIVPYYFFIDRDTGANKYFEVPLSRAYEIYKQAIRNVSGLARSARGPVMSTTHGKLEITGILEVNNEKFFNLRFLQARDDMLVGENFLVEYSDTATWYDQLKKI